MKEYLKNRIWEVESAADTAYILENNELFYDIGFKVMQNLENSCLLKCHRLKYNGKIKLVYLTSEYLPITKVIAEAEPNTLGNVIQKMFDAFAQIENLGFLDISCIVSDLDKIFIDPVSDRVQIIYLPINGTGEKKNRNVFENEVKRQLTRLIHEVQRTEHPKIRMILESLTDGTRRFYDEAVISDSGEKGICLQDISGRILFSIDGRDFVIGKSRDKVDGEIAGNPAVSRVHCKILYRDGNYFIVDMGSSNGTFLNGERVTAVTPLPIQVGSKVRIANMEFVVRGNER